MTARLLVAAAGGPNIPTFGGGGGTCSSEKTFCWGWVKANWHGVLQPALIQHIWLTAIAVGVGFVIATSLALLAYRRNWVERPVVIVTSILYTIPSLALFEFFEGVPGFGLSVMTAEFALVSYTLLIMFRNTLTGLRDVPDEVREAAAGMGLSEWQTLLRVELPLAVPAIVAGIRIATVTVISLATVASLVCNDGLGAPIFTAIGNSVFKTELIAAGVLAIVLAIVADGLLVLLQRLLTPWVRAG